MKSDRYITVTLKDGRDLWVVKVENELTETSGTTRSRRRTFEPTGWMRLTLPDDSVKVIPSDQVKTISTP